MDELKGALTTLLYLKIMEEGYPRHMFLLVNTRWYLTTLFIPI